MKIEMIIMGCDPGGAKANGVALIKIENSDVVDVRLKTCNYVDEVIEWILSKEKIVQLNGVGIDAFLSWSTGPSGWRAVDNLLKTKYEYKDNEKDVSNSVLSSNSTFGAMAVQGMALAIRLKAMFPNIVINETHPKVLYHAATGCEKIHCYSDFKAEMDKWLLEKLNYNKKLKFSDKDHEWDALISAWATWMGIKRDWKTDLMDYGKKQDNLILPAGDVRYYWPDPIDLSNK